MKTRRITYRENLEVFKQMEKVAPRGPSGEPNLSALLRMAVDDYLKKNGKPNRKNI